MRIGALAQQLGTTTDAIRFYERCGLLPTPSRADNRYREYTGADAERLRVAAKSIAAATAAKTVQTEGPVFHRPFSYLVRSRFSCSSCHLRSSAPISSFGTRSRRRSAPVKLVACASDSRFIFRT